jgi:DnaJ homolog subfamily C member 19
MGVILLVAAGLLAAAWFTGRLKGFTLDDVLSAALFLLGLRLLTTGRFLMGAALMAGAILYAGYRRGRFRRAEAIPIDDARRLLGVSADASIDDIRAAHRRLIARVHPDTGGSEELARRINAARDALIADRMRAGGRRGDSVR